MSEITNEWLQKIWSAHGLGDVQSVVQPKGGLINACRVVNDCHVIRFDLLDYAGVISRYQGEAIIYERLRGTAVPVPEVIALDLSKMLVPYAYIILSKMEGEPIIDNWTALSSNQQQHLGQSIGRSLALLHEQRFMGFGSVYNLNLKSWRDFITDFVNDMGDDLMNAAILDASVAEKCRTIIRKHESLFEIGIEGQLVHADYQFENILQKNGNVTAVIDFEWSLSGDPAWDFRLEDQWERECAGCRPFIYAGYNRTFAPDHDLRVRLYKLLQCLDDLYFLRVDHPDAEEFDREYWRFFEILDSFT